MAKKKLKAGRSTRDPLLLAERLLDAADTAHMTQMETRRRGKNTVMAFGYGNKTTGRGLRIRHAQAVKAARREFKVAIHDSKTRADARTGLAMALNARKSRGWTNENAFAGARAVAKDARKQAWATRRKRYGPSGRKKGSKKRKH